MGCREGASCSVWGPLVGQAPTWGPQVSVHCKKLSVRPAVVGSPCLGL